MSTTPSDRKFLLGLVLFAVAAMVILIGGIFILEKLGILLNAHGGEQINWHSPIVWVLAILLVVGIAWHAMTRPDMATKPFQRAFVCAFAVFALDYLYSRTLWPGPRELIEFHIGQVFAEAFIPAVVAGSLASISKKSWPNWAIIGVYVAILVITQFLLVLTPRVS
jgi:hypothetical protein